MLRRKQMDDGRTVSRMPFRKPLARDVWEPTKQAEEIGQQWKEIQRGGAGISFTETDA
jgi:Mg-chelatase subunit ChlD